MNTLFKKMFRIGKAKFEATAAVTPQIFKELSLSTKAHAPEIIIGIEMSFVYPSSTVYLLYRMGVSSKVKSGSQALTTCVELELIST